MNTHLTTAPEAGNLPTSCFDPVAGAGPLERGAVLSSQVTFGCPVCGSLLRMVRRSSEVAGVCPVCHSGVVAPQPELGCRAMTYRNWLRMQEIDWDRMPLEEEMAPRPSPTRSTRPDRPIRPRRRLIRWAAVGTLATVLGVGGWMGHLRFGNSSTAVPGTVLAPNPPPGVTPPNAPATVAASHSESATDAVTGWGGTSLAAVLDRSASPEAWTVVEATQAHDFARSAPPGDEFLCLKLTDATATARVYVPVGDAVATTAKALLPWGRDRRVTARLRWLAADPATGVAGHWRLVSLEDAAAALTLAH